MAIYAEVIAEVELQPAEHHGYVDRAILKLHDARKELQQYYEQNPSDWVKEGMEQIKQTVISLW